MLKFKMPADETESLLRGKYSVLHVTMKESVRKDHVWVFYKYVEELTQH